jgi:asparagine synthase (glutamine-hydrolysing)
MFSYRGGGPPVDPAELLRMREQMRPRGPDGAGLWLADDRRVGLAHRRLAIIDLSEAGAQPMLDPDTGNRIVFNGEIYNYRELRSELRSRGVVFRSTSDTEVLLHLYRQDGQTMLPKLRGMFAFAIWDAAQQMLVLARDLFGVKPLYYADDGAALRFASQVKALLAGGGVDAAPEPAGHVGFFLWGHVPEPFTLYRGTRALPAGHVLTLARDGRKALKAYFDLTREFTHENAPDTRLTKQQAQEQLRAALLDSVRVHLVADVPVGVFLSAGLDSATVAVLAKEAGVEDLRTLTLGFQEFAGTHHDEVPLAETVARILSGRHTTRLVARADFAVELERLVEAMDQPSIDGVNTYFVAKAAHEAGLKVVLSGLGGDELFGGYSDFRDIPRLVKWVGPLARIPGVGRGFRLATAAWIERVASPKWAGFLEYGGDFAGAYLLRRGLFMPWELTTVLDPDLVRAGWRDLQTLPRLRRTMDGVRNTRLTVSALELAWYMRNQLLRDTDWASMAHSVEVRVPLVDVELLRAVGRCIRAGFAPGKQDMAAAPAVPLPTEVLERRKTGFSVPVREWLVAGPTDLVGAAQRGLRGWARFVYRNVAAIHEEQAQPARAL